MLTASDDSTAHIETVGWSELTDKLRARTSAQLTAAQRVRYLAEQPDEAQRNFEENS